MTTLQRIVIGSSTAALSFGLAFAAVAGDGQPGDHGSLTINVRGKVELKGAVTKVDLAAKTLGVKVWGVEWTVKATDATKVAPKGRGALTLADVQVGHVVHVGGTLDASQPLVVTAKRIVDRDVLVKAAAHRGTITALTPPDAFELQLDRGGRLTVKVTADTKITEEDATKAYADLAVGTPIVVKGTYDARTNTLTATQVKIRPAADERDDDKKRGYEKPDFKGRGSRR